MTSDPRAALDAFIAALERHLNLSAATRAGDDTALRDAGESVGEAFLAYDEALFNAYGEATPLDIYSDDDYDEDDDDEDDVEDDDIEDEEDEDDDDEDFDDDFDEDDEDDEEDDEEDDLPGRGLNRGI